MPQGSAPGAYRYANDSVDLDDRFGTVRVGDEVARMALEVPTPFTLGVVGKWGAGKTTVLRRAFATMGGREIQVEVPFVAEARSEPGWNQWSQDWPSRKTKLGWSKELVATAQRCLAVWYSPWQHQRAANPLLPLLLELREQFSVRAKASDLARPVALAGLTLLERVIDSALVLTKAARRPVMTGTTEAVQKVWKEATADTRLDDGQRFQLLFADAVETVLAGLKGRARKDPPAPESATEPRLVVFIDDLDRCEESAIVELLEAIKLYVGVPRCVFVLGLDEGAVLAALGRHWKGRFEDDNREYLAKLFQAVVPVPLPQPPKVRAWVDAQLEAHGFHHAASCGEVVVDLIEPNPRKVKNFVNALCALWNVFDGQKRAGDDRERFEKRFVLLQYLRIYHQPMWRLLERDVRVLKIVTRVLTGGRLESAASDDFDPADQRVLESFVFRSFAHVLGRDMTIAEPSQVPASRDRHGHLSLADAVELLTQRLDRKRSDQKLIHHYKGLFDQDEVLPAEFLHLRDADGGHG